MTRSAHEPTTGALPDRLHLTIVAGPEAGSFAFDPSEAPVQIGRISNAACRLDDPTVSRRHAALRFENGAWIIEDAGSRGGTAVNGKMIAVPTRLSLADEIGIGPWRLRVDGRPQADSTITLSDDRPSAANFRSAPRRLAQPLELRRLTLLLDYADRLQRAGDEAELAAELLDAACRGASFTSGLVLRARGGDEADILAREGEAGAVSRSVLREAESGKVVQLSEAPELLEAQSLMLSGVRDVLCVPLQLDGAVHAYLYLTREQARAASDADESADFCIALARLAEITLASLLRRGLEREIRSAREAQERILPASTGAAPGFHYAMLSRPGRGVAGDLFDVVRVSDTRTAIFLGDITGKGAGPALLMTASQAFLNGELRRAESLASSVESLNAYLVGRSRPGEFLTLWIALFDAATRSLEYIDAGHGFAALAGARSEPVLLQEGGGPPLGVVEGGSWTPATVAAEPGDRLLLFSDGLAEQRSPAGKFFGIERALSAFAEMGQPDEIVRRLAGLVDAHAQGGEFADDLTLACAYIEPRASAVSGV
jgi:serine phosphatase RsbU (regulator of sigma subunit)